MVSEGEIERLRREADTIMTRYGEVERALERARSEAGDHWESGELALTLETPAGEAIEVTVDLDSDPSTHAQRRYDRASELEVKLDRRRSVVDQLAPLPADPVAYLVLYHLDTVEGNYPRSMAGILDAGRKAVERLCEAMIDAGFLERVESGTVKQRNVKAKKADEVRQHHTYYRLSREGDHLLRFLAEREGKRNVLRHLPEAARIARHLAEEGPDSPRQYAAAEGAEFEAVRHHCRALRRVGLVTTCDGPPAGEGPERSDGESGSGATHTFYETTAVAEELLAGLAE